MPNLVNQLVVRDLSAAFEKAEGLIVIGYAGLNAVENETLRDKLAEKGCELRMVRNALARLVLHQRGWELAEDSFAGNTAIAFGDAEAVIHAAKVLASAEVKKVGKAKARAGVLEGRLLGPADVAQLADVPDRTTLQARLLGCISGPARGLVSVLNGLPAGLARVTQARADRLAETGAAAG